MKSCPGMKLTLKRSRSLLRRWEPFGFKVCDSEYSGNMYVTVRQVNAGSLSAKAGLYVGMFMSLHISVALESVKSESGLIRL